MLRMHILYSNIAKPNCNLWNHVILHPDEILNKERMKRLKEAERK